MKILFIDDRPHEVINQWESSECASVHELLPIEKFQSLLLTQEIVRVSQPDVVVIGHGLGAEMPTGSKVIQVLRDRGFNGYVVANSGGGPSGFLRDGVHIEASANRRPDLLKQSLDTIEKGRAK